MYCLHEYETTTFHMCVLQLNTGHDAFGDLI